MSGGQPSAFPAIAHLHTFPESEPPMRFALALGSMPLLAPAAIAKSPDSSGADKLGFQLILQSWTTNRYNVVQSIDYAKQLGLHAIEIYPGQVLGGKSKGKWGPEMSD